MEVIIIGHRKLTDLDATAVTVYDVYLYLQLVGLDENGGVIDCLNTHTYP